MAATETSAVDAAAAAAVPTESGWGHSVNCLFALTAPRAGVLDPAEGLAQLERHSDDLDAAFVALMGDAWRAVAVPAAQYWRHTPQRVFDDRSFRGAAPTAAAGAGPQRDRAPQPGGVLESFFPTRTEAMACRRYTRDGDMVVVAADKRGGAGSKVFSVLRRAGGAPARETLPEFVAAVPRPCDRALYVLVDEAAPVDPFFDLDLSFPSGAAPAWWRAVPGDSDGARAEALLHGVMEYLAAELGAVAAVQHALALTSSVAAAGGAAGSACDAVKISFHLHFRLAGGKAFANVTELHRFAAALRQRAADRADSADSGADEHSDPLTRQRAHWVVRCVDFAVYTRWRAFRLPYCVKTPFAPGAFTDVDAAAEELLCGELAACGLPVPDCAVGCAAAAVLRELRLADGAAVRDAQERLLAKMMYRFRFLLPLVPSRTAIGHAALAGALARWFPLPPDAVAGPDAASAVARACFDLAAIQRGPDAAPLPAIAEGDRAPALQQQQQQPFALAVPPRPTSVRVVMHDARVKRLVSEVFGCLAPHYAAASAGDPARPIPLDRLTVSYEESIRAYYAVQKHSRYCLRQGRTHKATYAQLYLTYGSVKVRCYANDCCDRCLFVNWDGERGAAAGGAHIPGYPKYTRLAEIRAELFPPLPPEELLRRYGSLALP